MRAALDNLALLDHQNLVGFQNGRQAVGNDDGRASRQRNVERLLDRLLLKRFITVDEIADLVVYLFGPSAQSVTGSNWIIDGGVTAQ